MREREVDIGRLEADLHIDLKRQRLSGSITAVSYTHLTLPTSDLV